MTTVWVPGEENTDIVLGMTCSTIALFNKVVSGSRE